MDWSNMANPLFLFGYKWITSYSFAHIQENDERERKKTNGISWSLHSILFFCFNFVSEFNVCTRQLMALKKNERKMLKFQMAFWALWSRILLSCWNTQLGSSPLSTKGQGMLVFVGQGCRGWQCSLLIFMSSLER